MSDDHESDGIEKEAMDHISKQLAGAEAAMKAKIMAHKQRQEEAEAAAASLAATINTPEALRNACSEYLATTGFKVMDLVTWKGPIFKNRESNGPYIVVEIVPRDEAHRMTSADGDDFNPGSCLFGEVLDLCVGHLGVDNHFRMLWCDSRRMKLVAP